MPREATHSRPTLPNFQLAPLKALPPDSLLASQEDRVGAFFLALAIVLNDVKGLIWMSLTAAQVGEPLQEAGQVSGELGQLAGLQTMARRFLVGVLHELRELIRSHKDLVLSNEVRSLPFTSDARQKWEALVSSALEEQKGTLSIAMIKARSNLAFHYYQTPKVAAAGFLRHFDGSSSDPWRAHAYVSLGTTMEETRFYYADDAAAEAWRLSAEKTGFEGDFLEAIGDLAVEVNQALSAALFTFVASRNPPLGVVYSQSHAD